MCILHKHVSFDFTFAVQLCMYLQYSFPSWASRTLLVAKDSEFNIHYTHFIAVLENVPECCRVGAAVARETTTSVLASVQLCLLVG